MTNKIKGFCALTLLFTSGCAYFMPTPVPGVTVRSFHDDVEPYPDATTAYLHTVGEANLDATIDKVYDRLLDISHDAQETMPPGLSMVIDHSKSEAGPDQWGVGSTVLTKQGRISSVWSIDQCKRPNLIIVKGLHSLNDRIARSTQTYEIKQVDSQKTRLIITSYTSHSHKSITALFSNIIREQTMKKSLSRLVEDFGGEVVRVDAQTNKEFAPTQ
jgi:hypothetical protein